MQGMSYGAPKWGVWLMDMFGNGAKETVDLLVMHHGSQAGVLLIVESLLENCFSQGGRAALLWKYIVRMLAEQEKHCGWMRARAVWCGDALLLGLACKFVCPAVLSRLAWIC